MVKNYRAMPRLLRPRTALGKPDRFADAQRAFLQGNWLEAEAILRSNLRVEGRDAPALLLLAAVYRQTGRLEQAQRTLEHLGNLEVGDAWFLEARAERQRLERERRAVIHGESSTAETAPIGTTRTSVRSRTSSPIPSPQAEG